MKKWPATKFFARYQLRDLWRRKCHFCLAFCSVFFIVLATLVVTTIISKGPYIFLKLAQDSNGEIDAFIYPGVTDLHNHFINYTAMQSLIEDDPVNKAKDYRVSPRKVFTSAFIAQNVTLPAQSDLLDLYDLDLPTSSSLLQATNTSSNFNLQAPSLSSTTLEVDGMSVFFIDSDRENAIEIGRYYEYPALPAGGCIINEDLANGYLHQVKVNESLTLALDIQTLYDALIDQFSQGKKNP
jgi:hypothetical protein